MRRKYSIGAPALLLAAAFAAGQCPSELVGIAHKVAALRAVPEPFAPPCRVISTATLGPELDRKLRRDLPLPPDLFLEALHRLGLVDEAVGGLYDRLLAFYGSQVLGFYEPSTDEMVLVDAPAAAGLEGRLVWTHELAHAAQEHRYHLPSRLLGMRRDGDAQRAASAVAEGEAMLVMFLLDAAGADEDNTLKGAEEAMAGQVEALKVPGIPDYFVQDLAFPYTSGFAAVTRAYRRGGWPMVDRMLAAPPASTAALLHPDRPRPGTALPDADLPAVPAGWEEVLTDALGEWALRLLLARVVPEQVAARLAAGWDGDRIRMVRQVSEPGRWAMAWRLRCRDVAAREALARGLQRHLAALLVHLTGAPGPPELLWVAAGRTLEVRAGWPQEQPSRATSR